MWHFLEDVSLPLIEEKGDAGASSWPLPYMGEKVSAQSYVHGKLTDRGYW